jgi:hypothetical protein
MITGLALIDRVADNVDMTTLLIVLLGVVAFGLLAVFFGADSRHTDPRDLRPNL